MRRAVLGPILNSLLYFPSRWIDETPADAGLEFSELEIETEDGERLHAWWVPGRRPSIGGVLLCHGNGGNISGRVAHAAALCDAGLDVLLFDYRGYGLSSGRPSEEGTYLDARSARAALVDQPGAEGARVLYLGESLGGAVALWLALEAPPAGLVLQSAFTSVRDVGRAHYPFIPKSIVPDAYPNLRRIGDLRAPLLVIHGDQDEIVPFAHGQRLFAAASEPKRMHTFRGLGHNDLVALAATEYAEAIATWAGGLPARANPPPQA